MKKLIKITAIMLIAVIAISMVGCKAVDENGAKLIVKSLIESSYELNEIYYGKGLMPQATDSEDDNSLYIPVAGNENYQSRDELVNRTYEIFSDDLAESMIDMAFNGAQGAIGSTLVMARYIEYYGKLNVRRNIDGIEIAKYDFSTIEIEKNSRRFIRAKIKIKNSEKSEYAEITLINEDDGWRLDKNTF